MAFYMVYSLDASPRPRAPSFLFVSVPLPSAHTTAHTRWGWRSRCSESEMEGRVAEGRTSYIMYKVSCKNYLGAGLAVRGMTTFEPISRVSRCVLHCPIALHIQNMYQR